MARGWESKAVEAQLEAAETKRGEANVARKTPEQLRVESELEHLELSRRRVALDLEAAANPRYQEILRNSLRYLDEKISALKSAD